MQYKAHFVAKGFHQRLGFDFADTFSPVVKPTTIRILIHLTVTYSWVLRQLDVNEAFLHGSLIEDVFMQQPQGFRDPQFPQHVCKLQKAIYGLRQTPRAWYTKLQNFLLSIGFIISKSDSSLFIHLQQKFTMFLLIYVDDIIITDTSSQQVQQFITTLAHRFSLKDLGPLAYFLRVEAIHTSSDLFLFQYKYIRDLLEKHNMFGANAISTSISSTVSLKLHDGALPTDPTKYRQVIGSMQYLSLTRPDISSVVNKLS